METLNVDLGERSYPIYIGGDVLARKDCLIRHISGRQVMIVTNETVAPLYLEKVRQLLDGFDVDVTVLPDGEEYKNMESLASIFDHLIGQRHNRTTTLIALGGGVIGDMTGFAAASYQRGVNFIQIPTTLLSQVDSSVGGKTGINHPQGKNMIGAFYQPKAVLIDTSTLQTLPESEFSAGLAEVIKYGLIKDVGFLEWLESNLDDLMALDAEMLQYAIRQSCEVKAEVVAEDETEQGVRAILNLGHTFGHAIEAFTHYKEWLHGEAVAAGTVMAADLSLRIGDLAQEDYKRVVNILSRANLPVRPPSNMTAEDFIRYMSIDKKVLDGQLRLVLMRGLGSAWVTDQFGRDMLEQTLAEFSHH
ncbi:3-dehydroquinate synthase [Hahella sp. CCB-MM4]|uniref:3-dehydroquinate synthase n=1 Tax=Hahella sp. (strain CCB-MM4) TaxID=1926491 RepID=UPI000B9B19B6|nr:3-dehydroquinate synthase [Hahella sp. CCB-MM4]OZG71439.1 3-dehydroquinate synthase [Hahella sp. CCB-MM4]